MLTVIARKTGEPTVLEYLYKIEEDGTIILLENLAEQSVRKIFEEQDEAEIYIGDAEHINWLAQYLEDMDWIDDVTERLETDLIYTMTDLPNTQTVKELCEIMEGVEDAIFQKAKEDPKNLRTTALAIIQQTREDHDLPEDE